MQAQRHAQARDRSDAATVATGYCGRPWDNEEMPRLPLLALTLLLACVAPPPTGSSETAPQQQEIAGAPGSEPGDQPPPPEGVDQPPPGPDRTDPRPPASSKQPDDSAGPPILAAHNRYRARHCAPPLSWSGELVKESQRWAKNLAAHRCAFEHNPDPRYGENLAYFRPPGALGQEDVAEQWYREIDGYNFKKPGFSMEAGHFTQLVWVGTKRLGCASVECGGGELWVCNYDPPGNMQGDFDANVRQTGCK